MRFHSAWLAIAVAGAGLPAVPASGQADSIKALVEKIDSLEAEVLALRAELARAQVDAAAARREADELRQFIQDHHDLGAAFGQYTLVKQAAEREARRRRTDEARAEREADREARQQAANERRAREQADQEKAERYRGAGLTPIGLDVFAGKMAYYYRGKDQVAFDIDYDPILGIRYPRPYTRSEIDYSSMTISGSVVNGADEARNIGIAVVFFDEKGSQVGGQIVQVNNARKDVPYPFTTTVSMALNRAFSSSTVYVLYADAAAAAPPAPGAPSMPPATP
jgi:hypothetical protein